MPVVDDAVVFALTGAFGSGCSTLAKALTEDPGFVSVKVSDYIKAVWVSTQTPEGQLPLTVPPRGALQDLGDRYRLGDRAYWIKHIFAELQGENREIRQLVIDGIRNPAEIEYLRSIYVNAYLIAVDTHPQERWNRLMREPEWTSRTYEHFLTISSRDQEAPEDWGQRVQQCVDLADFVINNDEEFLGEPAAKEALRKKATDFLQLCAGRPRRRPNPDELFMHLAYAASAGSACLKRNVGAIVVRPGSERSVFAANKERKIVRQGVAISAGYNENPDWMSPCSWNLMHVFVTFGETISSKLRDIRDARIAGTISKASTGRTNVQTLTVGGLFLIRCFLSER